MPTREIPREEWSQFFNSFSQMHRGWLVTLQVLNPETGIWTEVHHLPLDGVVADIHHRENALTILVNTSLGGHVAHAIPGPTHVHMKETDQGAHDALQIQSSSGDTVLLQFRSAMRPETLDGVASVGRT